MRFAILLVFAAACGRGQVDADAPPLQQAQDAAPLEDAGVVAGDAIACSGGVRNVVYQGHCYVLYATVANITWAAAKTACEQARPGGHLVTYGSAEENAVVSAAHKPTGRTWIGANDITTEGKFVWVTGEPFAYTYWQPNEPSNGGATGNEDCLSQTGASTDWQWNDLGCDGGAASTFGYACEFSE